MATTGLVGCAIGAASFPDASVNPAQIPLGSISGSDFGGHAPLVGAHVYVLQPSVTTAGATSTQTNENNAYGAQATSLLTASYSNNGSAYPATVKNASDPGIPTSWYYLNTDSTGSFNITGDYTCTAGIPVYLYLYGGSPTFPSGSNAFSISSITVTGSSNPYTVTFTTTTTENAYVGETVTFTGFTGSFASLNNSVQTIVSANLTTNTFSINTTAGTAGTYAQSTPYGTATLNPTNNSGVVNLAVLGNCPSTGSFSGTNKISYVYVNEISTVAAAYAFRPFTNTPQTTSQGYQTDCLTTYTSSTGGATTTYDWNNATCIGTSSKNLAGLQNAATLAGQLYDITGSNLSTTYAGEGHIARANTTNGNGIVPQAMINTLGNILAQCVDSNNGATLIGSSTISSQCTTLFTAATSNGIPVGATGAGIQPFDTAMAAINIARRPGGPPASYSSTGASTFMTNLYTLPNASNRPFEPDLFSTGAGQPNDFSIGILYPQSLNGSYGNVAESIAIDKIGNVWVTAQNNGAPYYFYEMSPTGVRSNIQSQTTGIYGYVTIDPSGTAYSGLAQATGPITYVKVTGTSTSGNPATGSYGYPAPYTYSVGSNTTQEENYTYAAFADPSGNIYFGNNGTGGTVNYIVSYTSATATGQESPAIPTFASKNGGITHAAMEPTTGYAYIDFNASGSGNGIPYLASVNVTTGANSYTPITNTTSGCTSLVDPEQMAVTLNGDGLFPDYNNGAGALNAASSSLYFVTSLTSSGSGTCAQISGATVQAGLNSPFGAVIDGGDYAYITNRGNQNGTTISVLNMTSATSTVSAVSPSTGIQPSYVNSSNALTAELYGPLNIAAGPSGELWITNPAGNSLVEIIGLAKPTVTPLASAAFTTTGYAGGTVGTRP